MSRFSLDIKRFAEKTDSNIDQATRAIILSLFSGVIRDTRVDTGRLRGNWQTTTGSPSSSQTNRLDPTGNAAVNEVQSNMEVRQVNYLTNNLPYAPVWEQKDGMIARNMARVQRNVAEAVASVRR